jgi:Putative MetA-pathway of phenol degradation
MQQSTTGIIMATLNSELANRSHPRPLGSGRSRLTFSSWARSVSAARPVGSFTQMTMGAIAALYAGLICLSLIWSSPAFAGRPLVVDDARIVAEGYVEVEFGLVQSLPENGGRDQQWPVMAATYGLYKNLEVGLGIQRANTDLKGEAPFSGFQDLNFAAKYDFFPSESYDLSFAFNLKIPTANRHRGLSTGKFDETFLFIATKHMFPAAIDLNLGYTVVGRRPGEKLENRFFGGVALRYGLNERWRLVGDIYGLSREAKGEKNQANFQIGVRFRPDLPVFFDAAIGRSLLASGTRIQGTLGLTWSRALNF